VITGTAGEGGMGVVYRVYDPRLRREVALKRLRPRNSAGGELDATSKARLLAEARAMASLSHPNVLPVYDVEVIDGDLCVTMEYVEGVTLRQWRRHNDPSWYHIVDELIEAGEGLAAAHRAGLVHRDFKPTNAMIGADGRVRVMDFGLATRRSDAESASVPALHSVTTATVDDPDESDPKTEDGVVMGTPAYMAPEQHDGLPADARSDQFAFCVSAFELLYGRRPYAAKGAKALAKAKRHGRIRKPPARSGVPRSIHRILMRGLSVEPAMRWPSMDALLTSLRRARAWRRRRPFVIGGGLVATGALLYFFGPDAACRGDDELEAVWNSQRAERIEAAMRSTDVPAALEQWPYLEARIDEYARDWLEQYRNNCEAAGSIERHSEEHRGRERCLQDRLQSLDVMLDVLEDSDTELVTQAHRVVSGLPAVEVCAPSSRGFAALTPPDGDVAAEVDAIERATLRAEALALGGHVREAMRLQNQLLGRARSAGYQPVLARVLWGLATSHADLGEYELAVSLGREAFLLALATGDDIVAIETALLLAHSVSDGLHHPEEGRHWVDEADALVARANLSDRWRGRVAYTRGSVLHSEGKLESARDSLIEAIGLLGDTESTRDALYRSSSHNNLGLVYRELGQTREALVQFETALELHRRVFGDSYPLDGTSVINIAMAKAELGDVEGALAEMKAAHEHYVRGYGEHSWPAIVARGNIAAMLGDRGENDEADLWFDRMERSLGEVGKTTTLEYAKLQANRARLAARRGEPREAKRRWGLAMDTLDELQAHGVSSAAELRFEYARYLLSQEQYAEARNVLILLDRELPLVVSTQHPLVIRVRIALADALLGMDRANAALDIMEPTLALAEGAAELGDEDLAHLRFLLAQTLWEMRPGQRERAWQLAISARDGLRRQPDLAPELVGEIANWLDGHGPEELLDR
jgi:tetratricopeptide (TPR) repeat protein/tRNA A-37 threonylcarbamoyl transferase component Bud32